MSHPGQRHTGAFVLQLRQDKSASQLENLPSRYGPSSSAGSQVQIEGGIERESGHSALRFPDPTPTAVTWVDRLWLGGAGPAMSLPGHLEPHCLCLGVPKQERPRCAVTDTILESQQTSNLNLGSTASQSRPSEPKRAPPTKQQLPESELTAHSLCLPKPRLPQIGSRPPRQRRKQMSLPDTFSDSSGRQEQSPSFPDLSGRLPPRWAGRADCQASWLLPPSTEQVEEARPLLWEDRGAFCSSTRVFWNPLIFLKHGQKFPPRK